MNQSNFFSKLNDKRTSTIIAEIEKFISNDFQYIQNMKEEEISKNIQDFITKILFDFAKTWDIVNKLNKKVFNFKKLTIWRNNR